MTLTGKGNDEVNLLSVGLSLEKKISISLSSNHDLHLTVLGSQFLFFDVLRSLVEEDSGYVEVHTSFCALI